MVWRLGWAENGDFKWALNGQIRRALNGYFSWALILERKIPVMRCSSARFTFSKSKFLPFFSFKTAKACDTIACKPLLLSFSMIIFRLMFGRIQFKISPGKLAMAFLIRLKLAILIRLILAFLARLYLAILTRL